MRQVKNEGWPILKVLCGSRAYGLENPDSDYDYHGVFIVPTNRILSLGSKIKETSWIEGTSEDNTAWELKHFLELAVQCNPTVLETFMAPRQVLDIEDLIKRTKLNLYGSELTDLFPAVISRKRIYASFKGYAKNQLVKFMNLKGEEDISSERHGLPNSRIWKFASAYLRVLYHGEELLRTGTYSVYINNENIRNFLKEVKAGTFSRAQVIWWAEEWERLLEEAMDNSKVQEEADYEKINDFLLRARRAFW